MTDPAEHLLDLPVDSTLPRAAAQLYVQAGFAPVPVFGVVGGHCTCGRSDCAAVGKHPVGTRWQQRAAVDIDVARELFAEHDGNIGLVVGAEHVVLDIDEYAGGLEGLKQLPPLPPTLTSRSGSGQGEHRIFRYAPGQDPSEVTNRKIAPGVDIKTRTGQIVVAPSMHRSGNRYQWIDRSPPAPLPDALYERIRKRRVVPIRAASQAASPDEIERRAMAYIRKIPGGVEGQNGGRDCFRVAAACWGWIARGLSESTAFGLFQEYLARCDPPWTDPRQIDHKWQEGKRARVIPQFEDREIARRASRERMTPEEAIAAMFPVAPEPGDAQAASDAPKTAGAVAGPGPGPDALPDWRTRLLFQPSKNGPPKLRKHHENAVVVLRYHPDWVLPSGKPRLQFDEHACRVLVTEPPWHDSDAPATTPTATHGGAREWTDADSARLSAWICREVSGLELSVSDCDRAVTITAESNTCHPFRDYLDSLAWDGVPRLRAWLSDHLEAPDTPYTRAVGRWWLIAAAARTYDPGCKADNVLILEGDQGIRKSSALRVLAGARWFSDTPIDIGSKDAYLALQGRVIVELAELDSLKRADADRAKVFFSSPVDQYRPPYGRRTISVPRSCIFAGTVNPESAYLVDTTGNRRYWPVRCGTVNLAGIAEARDQLWAEAAAMFRAGASCEACRKIPVSRCTEHRWWPEGENETAMCVAEQAPRGQSDSWEETIETYVAGRDEITMTELLRDGLRLQVGDHDRTSQMRAARILAGLKFRRVQRRVANRRVWYYERGVNE